MTTKIDVSELKTLGKVLRKAAPAVARDFGKGLLAYGELVAVDAKQNASWSSRIPGTIKARRRAQSVTVMAGGSSAPHAPAYENKGRGGSFRHPVFRTDVNPDTWVQESARPFLGPAAEADLEKGLLIIVTEVDRAITRAGIH